MGMRIALTHIFSGTVLILLGDFSINHFITDPASQIFWIKLISYSIITIIGIHMLIQKIKNDNQCCSCGCNHNIAHIRSGSLAFSIGLVPCPCTMLILLYALANDMVWFGILLTIFKGIGIALTLSLTGIIAHFTRNKLNKIIPDVHKYTWINFIEYAGSIFIVLLGLFELSSFFVS